jgi:hypothetical protein
MSSNMVLTHLRAWLTPHTFQTLLPSNIVTHLKALLTHQTFESFAIFSIIFYTSLSHVTFKAWIALSKHFGLSDAFAACADEEHLLLQLYSISNSY